MKDMKTALSVSEFHDVAQDVDHQVALLLFLVDLFHDQSCQFLLFGIKYQSIDYPAVNDQRIKRSAYIIRDPQLICTLHMERAALRRDHNDRDLIDPVASVHHFQDTEAIHLRHHDIQQNKGKLHSVFLDRSHCLHPILCLNDLIFTFQHISQNRPIHLRVICNQYFLFKLLFLAHLGSFLK